MALFISPASQHGVWGYSLYVPEDVLRSGSYVRAKANVSTLESSAPLPNPTTPSHKRGLFGCGKENGLGQEHRQNTRV